MFVTKQLTANAMSHEIQTIYIHHIVLMIYGSSLICHYFHPSFRFSPQSYHNHSHSLNSTLCSHYFQLHAKTESIQSKVVAGGVQFGTSSCLLSHNIWLVIQWIQHHQILEVSKCRLQKQPQGNDTCDLCIPDIPTEARWTGRNGVFCVTEKTEPSVQIACLSSREHGYSRIYSGEVYSRSVAIYHPQP